MAWTETRHADADALARAVASALQDAVATALAGRGHALLALAGGRTPVPIYRQLAEAPLDWSQVSVLATDERWVDADHPASNTGELRRAFATAQGVRILPLTPVNRGGQASAELAEATLASLPGPFDAVLLGMGADGHFASLFPGAAGLATALDPDCGHAAVAMQPDPLPAEAPFPRISLSAARLLHTRRLLLAATGAPKRAVLDRAQAQCDPVHLPVSALLHENSACVEIHWSP